MRDNLRCMRDNINGTQRRQVTRNSQPVALAFVRSQPMSDSLERLLENVRNQVRYLGGEINAELESAPRAA